MLHLGPVDGLRLVRADHWHITLRFLGEVAEELVPTIADSLRSATAALGTTRCDLGPTTAWFSGHRVLQIPARGLDRVAAAVRAATVPIVPETSESEIRFTGHMTIARARRQSIDRAARMSLAGIPVDSTFSVDALDLVKSELASEGPDYTTLARIPLQR